MSNAEPNRIKPNYRPAVPLPAPPKLLASMKSSVATQSDVGRMDTALADWWNRFQSALAMNIQVQPPIDCGVASLGRTRIQLRRGNAADWTSANPILADGEIGIESDTRKAKIGDGSNQWSTLSYAFVA